jgi:hypothetical protein
MSVAVRSRFVYRHEQRRPLGTEPVFLSYEPSFFVPPLGLHGHLSPTHEGLVETLADIRGKLQPADQLKLYEAAHFARGPVLEVGRLHGKSTVALAAGLRDGGSGERLYSIELQAKYRSAAEHHLGERGLLELVTLLDGDSVECIAALPGDFDTVFLDGDHSYEGVARDLDALRGRLRPGGVLLVHDLFHPANESGEYGVARATAERLDAMGLAYRGRFGGIALFEREA